MLVLSRKSEQSVIIGDVIVVTILGIEGDRVKIGIAAPPEITILRREVLERAKRQPRSPDGEVAPASAPGPAPR
jgi:carbon storage regulator